MSCSTSPTTLLATRWDCSACSQWRAGIATATPPVFAVAGALLAASTLIQFFTGAMFTAAAAAFEASRTVTRRTWSAAIFNAAYAALPLVVGAAVVTALE